MISISRKIQIKRISIPALVLILAFSPVIVAAQQITTPPTVVTRQADHIVYGATANGNSAYLNGQVNPNGLQTVYWFEYGPTTGLGFVTPEQTVGSNTILTDVFTNVVGLAPGTNYFRIAARSNAGLIRGSIASFVVQPSGFTGGSGSTVPRDLPTAVTTQASSINTNSSSAYMNGRVNPKGQYTTAWFEYGPTPSLGYTSGEQYVGSGWLETEVKFFNLGLNVGTNYFRIAARNDSGIVRGSIISFVMAPAPSYGGTTSSPASTGGQYVFTQNSQGTTETAGNGEQEAASGLGFGGGAPSNGFFSQVAGTSDVNESDPGFYALFTKKTGTEKDNVGAVITTKNLKADAGDTVKYVAIFKNDIGLPMQQVGFKITLPDKAVFIKSKPEPTETRNGIVEFNIGTISIFEQKEVVVEVEIDPSAVPGSHLVFSSIMTYKGGDGFDHAITSYSVLDVVGAGAIADNGNFLTALLGPLAIFTNLIWLGIAALAILAAFLIWRYNKNKATIIKDLENKQKETKDKSPEPNLPFNLPGVPTTKSVFPLRYKSSLQK